MLQRKRPSRAKAKTPPPPAKASPPAKSAGAAGPDGPTLDREGRPIRAGALVVEHAGGGPNPTFGRVVAAAGQVLLIATFPGNEHLDGTDTGSVIYAHADACSVIEDPPPRSPLPPVAAAAVDLAARLAAIQNELILAASEVTGGCEFKEAEAYIGSALDEMMGIIRMHVGDADSRTELADALRDEGKAVTP